MTGLRPGSWRTLLFVPGSRPERFEKVIASGADAVCIDLEDSVTDDRKDMARTAAIEFLREVLPARPAAAAPPKESTTDRPEVVLRMNHPESETGLRDLAALGESGVWPDALMLPKVDGPTVVREVARVLDASGDPEVPVLLPLIETARGLHHVEEIATASPRVAGLPFGGMDLAAELGATTDWDSLLYARSRIVHAAALAQIGALDVPFADVNDDEGLEEAASAARRLGFSGKMAIHPRQVPIIQGAYAPDEQEVRWAERVLEAAAGAQADGRGAILLDGRMVDRPIVRAAQAILARAGEA